MWWTRVEMLVVVLTLMMPCIFLQILAADRRSLALVGSSQADLRMPRCRHGRDGNYGDLNGAVFLLS